MAVKFQDYYEILETPRSATNEEIQAAYRKLARKYHPDINKNPGAEEQFKKIGEAYEVLKDPERRKRYDMLGKNWRQGQDFTPPPGWEFHTQGFKPGGAFSFDFGDLDSGFSDFFEVLFGDLGGFGGPAGNRRGKIRSGKGPDQEAEIIISLREAYEGGKKSFTLQIQEPDERGRVKSITRTFEVNIPAGINPGRKLRLSGQGGRGRGGGPAGDLYLLIRIAPHPVFRIDGADLEVEVSVTPWEAALGARIQVPVVEGKAAMRLPAGTSSGHRLRLRGKGLAGKGSGRGDLYVVIRIAVPKKLSPQERELFEQLGRSSTFRPREG